MPAKLVLDLIGERTSRNTACTPKTKDTGFPLEFTLVNTGARMTVGVNNADDSHIYNNDDNSTFLFPPCL